jgi:hypothetical protein
VKPRSFAVAATSRRAGSPRAAHVASVVCVKSSVIKSHQGIVHLQAIPPAPRPTGGAGWELPRHLPVAQTKPAQSGIKMMFVCLVEAHFSNRSLNKSRDWSTWRNRGELMRMAAWKNFRIRYCHRGWLWRLRPTSAVTFASISQRLVLQLQERR